MKSRTIYYSDERSDDFAATNIKSRVVDEHFPFIHTSLLWRIASFFLYYIIAIPLVFLIDKVWYGLRIRNRKALFQAVSNQRRGLFLYGNHTQYLTDATAPALIAFPRRAYVIAGADAVSIKGLGSVVQMLGGLILPTEKSGTPTFRAVVQKRCEKNAIAIFPEAHIWPYYTGIRDFSSASFLYPVAYGCPVAAFVTTYRKRLLPFLPPAITITVSDLFYPDPELEEHAARQVLRDQVYDFMCRQAENNEVEYIHYEKKGPGGQAF